MLRKSVYILLVMTAAIGVVCMLAWTTIRQKNEKNGFVRKFEINLNPAVMNVAIKDPNILNIAGAIEGQLYFKTRTPGKIIATNYKLGNKRVVSVDIPEVKNLSPSFICLIDSSGINIMAGNLPGIITAPVNGGKAQTHRFRNAAFSRAVKISANSYVLRGFDSTVKSDQIFIKRNLHSGVTVKAPNVIERKEDAGITTDGFLHYDSKTNLLTYIFFYANKFICMDTSLNLVNVWNTIDKTYEFQIKANIVEQSITNTTPALVVNDMNCVSNGKLYNISRLRADNEIAADFDQNSVVDIYDIKTGIYERSFYIPNYNGERVIRFKIINDLIIILYRSYLATYQLTI
jgi:hypothetical protein